jgi:hypothetical protein
MVPFEAFSSDWPHSSIAFCNGCVGGTQCDSFSSTVLSCASACGAAASATASPAIGASFSIAEIDMILVPPFGDVGFKTNFCED